MNQWAVIVTVLAVAGAAPAAEIDFASQIQPIFLQHCRRCHGEKKAQSGLRLHTAAAIRARKEAQILVPGKPQESELYLRITLPADDEGRMPKGGEPLPPDKVERIRLWIEQGARLPEVDAVAKADDAPPDVAPADSKALDVLRASGASVLALHTDSPLLQVSFAQADGPPGDQQIAVLPKVAAQIAWLDLAGTRVTDDGLAVLSELENLSRLHLEQTSVGDEALAHLAHLSRLEYLNLYGTRVTDAGLAHLRALPKLRKLFLWQTGVSYQAAVALEEALPGLEVDLGWDHPEVVRARLTKELALVRDQIEEAANREKMAREEKESLVGREREIQTQLETLGQPATPKEAKEPDE
jgi:hypothetical protein